MDILATAARVAGRAGLETRYGAVLLHARGPGVLRTPPHRFLGVLRDLAAYGPPGAAVSLATAGFGDRPAIVDDRGVLTFAELEADSNALANALRERGFGPQDGLGVLVRNHRGLFVTLLAGAKLGSRTLLLNTDFAGPQLADVCRSEDVTTLVHDAEFAPLAAGLAVGTDRYLAWSERDADADAPTLDELIAAAPRTRPPRPPHRQRVVLLTSGTTGAPKGAPRDMALSLALPGGYLSKIPLRSGRTVVLAAPGFHAWGLLSAMLALGLGNTLVLTRRVRPDWMLDALERHDADALVTVPILLARLLALGDDAIRSRDLEHLRVLAVSGSALPVGLARHASDVFGDVVYNLYGSTEVAYATIATPTDLRAAPGTVGRPPPGTTITVLDDDGAPVPTGTTGRIFVGSSMQFEGYTGGGTKDVVAGRMSTGDVGHLDAAGRLFVEGRDDDMIVSGGENVFPAELEELLGAHDAIDEAAVVGVDDDTHGQRLRAYVVRSDESLDADAVRDHVRANLARFKVPRDVVFVAELPRNPAGKVIKRDLPEPP